MATRLCQNYADTQNGQRALAFFSATRRTPLFLGLGQCSVMSGVAYIRPWVSAKKIAGTAEKDLGSQWSGVQRMAIKPMGGVISGLCRVSWYFQSSTSCVLWSMGNTLSEAVKFHRKVLEIILFPLTTDPISRKWCQGWYIKSLLLVFAVLAVAWRRLFLFFFFFGQLQAAFHCRALLLPPTCHAP